MLRLFLTVTACLLLAGCSGWISDERIFGRDDWARVDLAGRYRADAIGSDGPTYLLLTQQTDGMIEANGTDSNGAPNNSLIGLVPIDGGAGEYFLMVNRTDPESPGDSYYIANLSGGQLRVYFPSCEATPDIEGVEKVRKHFMVPAAAEGEDATSAPAESDADDAEGWLECHFSTREALMTAGLEAEGFLDAPHIVEIAPAIVLSPNDGDHD